MAQLIEITQLSPTMKEGILVEWDADEGAALNPGDIIAHIETDKAVMELEVYDEGILLAKLAQTGARLPVGAPIAILGQTTEDIENLRKDALQKLNLLTHTELKTHTPAEQHSETDLTEPAREKELTELISPSKSDILPNKGDVNPNLKAESSNKILASPLAKKLAEENSIELSSIKGTGPNGRIVKRDVEKAQHENRHSTKIIRAKDQIIQVSMMRMAIAERLTAAKNKIPHYYLNKKFNATKLLKLRKEINTDRKIINPENENVSVNDFIIRACALALKVHPNINASWHEESGTAIVQKNNIDIGVAVAMPDGLLTPIIRNADQKSVFQTGKELKSLATRARKRALASEEYLGGSFTISNLGMFEIDSFTAIINAPESALLAVGRLRKVPVFNASISGFEPADEIILTLSCDHRVIDGAAGAEFLKTLTSLLENPASLI